MDNRVRLVDVLEARWREELDMDMPRSIAQRWLGFAAAQDISEHLLANAAKLISVEELSKPLAVLDHVARARFAERHDVEVDLLLEARALVESRGWPTGVLFIRGTHSGSYVPHPLGFDTADDYAVVGAHRPTLLEIAQALKAGDQVEGSPSAQHTEGE